MRILSMTVDQIANCNYHEAFKKVMFLRVLARAKKSMQFQRPRDGKPSPCICTNDVLLCAISELEKSSLGNGTCISDLAQRFSRHVVMIIW